MVFWAANLHWPLVRVQRRWLLVNSKTPTALMRMKSSEKGFFGSKLMAKFKAISASPEILAENEKVLIRARGVKMSIMQSAL